MVVRIRNLTIDDYDRIIEIWESAKLPYKPEGRDSRESIKKQMEEFGDLFLGAEVQGRLVGVIIGSWDGRKGWLNRIAVEPSYQGMGIGKMLTSACEEALKERGARIFAMLIEEDNVSSLKLAERMGYKVQRSILYLTKRENDKI
uniref:GNAT family N-acetyltransferase n=1 Tax=candidate division WOR-3 bacterium TaxID=2052148 RepID=A0A7C4UDC0_UNCW3